MFWSLQYVPRLNGSGGAALIYAEKQFCYETLAFGFLYAQVFQVTTLSQFIHRRIHTSCF
jgi:hypothetical protein